jgi:hypothetical protein
VNCSFEMPPWAFDIHAVSPEWSYSMEPRWSPVTGIDKLNFLLDVRNRFLAGTSGIEVIPAYELAAVRTDRPDVPNRVGGTAANDVGLSNYVQTIGGGAYLYVRRGVAWRLTGMGATFARAEGLLYTSGRLCGKTFPGREVIFNPTNDKNLVSIFPLTKPFPSVGVSKAKLGVVGLDNTTTTMQYRLAARAFNDFMARGVWTLLESDWPQAPGTGDFIRNTTEVDFTGITLGNFYWVELALAVRKTADIDTNSRVIFHVIPAIKYA